VNEGESVCPRSISIVKFGCPPDLPRLSTPSLENAREVGRPTRFVREDPSPENDVALSSPVYPPSIIFPEALISIYIIYTYLNVGP
jgi:hypothetical protein